MVVILLRMNDKFVTLIKNQETKDIMCNRTPTLYQEKIDLLLENT